MVCTKKCKDKDDWVFAYRNFLVFGIKRRDRGKKTWKDCIQQDTKALGLKKRRRTDLREGVDLLEIVQPC